MSYLIIGAEGRFDDIDSTLNKLKKIAENEDVVIQLFNSKLIFGKEHLQSAVYHAKRSFDTKTNLADDMGIEILLYASGERQIKLAINKLGISKVIENFALLIYKPESSSSEKSLENIRDRVLDDLHLDLNDSVLAGDIEVLKAFGIGENEIQAVPEKGWVNLILERVAMVDIIK